ncbi:MAG: SOS response-associated peptidase family protein [Acetobacteraceae bacterium]
MVVHAAAGEAARVQRLRQPHTLQRLCRGVQPDAVAAKVPEPISSFEPRDDIWPTETAPVLRRTGREVKLVQLRWGFASGRPKAGPVINFRSEGRRFPAGRCLVPASHFYEFTGSRSPKSKWRFTEAGEGWFCFAGLWRPAAEGVPEAFTLLTATPGPDVVPIHNRKMVVLERAAWLAWLDLGLGGAAAASACRQPARRTGAVSEDGVWSSRLPGTPTRLLMA